MAAGTGQWFGEPSTNRLDYLAMALVVITGIVHLYEGVEDWGEPIAIWFLLAGIGFFGAIVLFLLGFRPRVLYLVGIAYTGIQVIAYVVINWPTVLSPIGVFDKIVQLVLIGTLVTLYRERS